MKTTCRISHFKWICALVLSCFASHEVYAYNSTYEVNVGETFTVYTTYKANTYAVLWDFDWSVVEPVGQIYETSTSVTFRAIAPSPSVGSVIQAVTYYYRSGTSASGANKSVDNWKVIVKDNTSVYLDKTSMGLSCGQSDYLTATTSGSSYSGSYACVSSNSNVAYVSGYGRSVNVIANNPGSAVITVSLDNGKSAQCYVTVQQVDPTSISITSAVTAYVGESTKLSYSLTPSNAQTTLSWYTNDAGVASVNSSGSVTGVAEGTTKVYARTSNGLVSNYCDVTVKYRKATSVSLNKQSLYLPIGKQQALIASVSPANALYTLTWVSDNEDVATVSSTGMVVAQKAGQTNIRVVTDNGMTAVCVVTVPPNPASVDLPDKISLLHGKKRQLVCTSTPADAYLSLQWISSQPKVASVSSDGTITAGVAGTAEIKVVTSNGLEATCQVEVEAPQYDFVAWMHSGEKVSYRLSEHPVIMQQGDKLRIETATDEVEMAEADVKMFTFENNSHERMPEAIVLQESVTLDYKTTMWLQPELYPLDYDIETVLTWESAQPDVVQVSREGVITAVGVGEADVVVTASNGTSASCRVIVPEPTFYLITWLKSGRKDAYALTEHPVVTYVDGNLLLVTSLQEMEYPATEVRKFTLADNDNPEDVINPPVSISQMENRDEMQLTAGAVRFSGCRPGSEIKVYTLGGMLWETKRVNAEGRAVVQTSHYPTGVYIIKSETITHKIIRK